MAFLAAVDTPPRPESIEIPCIFPASRGIFRDRVRSRLLPPAVSLCWGGHRGGAEMGRILRAAWPIAEELLKLAWPTQARGCGGPRCRWGRHPQLRHMVSPMVTPMANEAADRVPAVVARTGRRLQFSEENKRLIVEETPELLKAADPQARRVPSCHSRPPGRAGRRYRRNCAGRA
jgi:hypothetical protein